MAYKEPLYENNEKAYDLGLEAKLSIQFIKEPDGKMSVLSCSVIKGYDNVDYALALDTTLAQVIKDLLER